MLERGAVGMQRQGRGGEAQGHSKISSKIIGNAKKIARAPPRTLHKSGKEATK